MYISCEVIGCPHEAKRGVPITTTVESGCRMNVARQYRVCPQHEEILLGTRPFDGSLSFVVEMILSGPI